jgi:hypothetical protein
MSALTKFRARLAGWHQRRLIRRFASGLFPRDSTKADDLQEMCDEFGIVVRKVGNTLIIGDPRAAEDDARMRRAFFGVSKDAN